MKSLTQFILEAQSENLQRIIDEIQNNKSENCSVEIAEKIFKSLCKAFWENKAKEIKKNVSVNDIKDGSLWLFNDSREAFVCRYINDEFVTYNVSSDEEETYDIKGHYIKGPETYSESDFEKEFKAFQKRALDGRHSGYVTFKGSSKYFKDIKL